MNGKMISLRVEELGERSLLSGFGLGLGFGFGGFGGGFFSPPSAAVQADLMKLHTDEQQLGTDLKTLAPTLRTDRQALATAVQTALTSDTAVMAAKTTLTTDRMTWGATLKTDWQAIFAATDSTSRSAAIKQLRDRFHSGWHGSGSGPNGGAQMAITADTGVAAATTQLQNDAAPIIADKAAIHADLAQLKTDIHAGNGSPTMVSVAGM